MLALVLGSAALAALGLTASFAAIWVCLLLLGAANMMWHPAAISYLSIQLPKNRGYSMAMHSLGADIGDAAGPLAAGWLLVSYSWQSTAQINAIPEIVCALLILITLKFNDVICRAPALAAREYWKGLAELISDRAQWSFFLMAGCRTMTQAGLLAFLPLYLAHDLGISSSLMGVTMMVLQLGGMVATPIAGILSDRVRRGPIVLAGMFARR